MSIFDIRRRGNRKLALKTLEELNPDYSETNFKILNYSHRNDSKQRENVHLNTNLLIQSCLKKNSLGKCIHITGRMSALNDPFHADLCTNIFRQTENPFQFSYFDQEEPDTNALSIVKQKQIMWSQNGWRHTISALKKESQSQIEAYALSQTTPIQYTVFGNKYVQLQSSHNDSGVGRADKHVWLIESEEVNAFLLAEAQKTLNTASHIPPNLFREAYNLVAGIAGKAVLYKFNSSNDSKLNWNTAVNVASDLHEDPTNVIQALKEFEFIHHLEDNQYELTKNGRQLLEQFEIWKSL